MKKKKIHRYLFFPFVYEPVKRSSQAHSRPQPDTEALEQGEVAFSQVLDGDYRTVSMDGLRKRADCREEAKWGSMKGQAAAGVGTGQPWPQLQARGTDTQTGRRS